MGIFTVKTTPSLFFDKKNLILVLRLNAPPHFFRFESENDVLKITWYSISINQLEFSFIKFFSSFISSIIN